VNGQLHASAVYLRGNRPEYALARRLGLYSMEKRKILSLPGIEPPLIRLRLITLPTEISELPFNVQSDSKLLSGFP
jgi:hypothetical protein